MEIVVSLEANEETKVEYGVIQETGSEPISLKHISDPDPDPVVYKLVRVDGEGRLVPATDDEVFVVEDLLKDEKPQQFASDCGQPAECNKTEGRLLEKTHFQSAEVILQSENLEVDGESSNVQLDVAGDLGEKNVQPEETVCQLASPSDGSNINQSMGVVGCSGSEDGLTENGSSNSNVATSLKPDFSKLKGEICLDNLTVKELQETFRATFGRETSVKDKQWLKRRISMGLTNSCDFSTMTFVIKDNEVLKKGKKENRKNSAVHKDVAVGVTNETSGGPLVHKQTERDPDFDDKQTQSPVFKHDNVREDPSSEQRAAKRVRKPTKRYIEEISEVESRDSNGRLVCLVKSSEHGQSCSKDCSRPGQNVRSVGRPMVTRQDSLGGSGVKVPYVSRVRRGRPRENFIPLMKLQPNGIGLATRMVKRALGEPGPPSEYEKQNKVTKLSLSAGWIQKPIFAASEKGNHYLERMEVELKKDVELKRMGSFEGSFEDDLDMGTIPAPSGGMRRKHHRPWSLTEVVKLVEGVARYGAGRWSEIKRLAFASYSYRTSVDLKDKWRNLLRASFSQLPAENGMQNTRKHASIPIPAPILLRVRELAQMQARVPPTLSSSEFSGHSGGSDRSVHEARSGYL